MAITKDMSILEVVQKYPDTVDVFVNAGMGCLGCAAAHFENIEQGAMAHGIDVDALIEGLNEAVGSAEQATIPKKAPSYDGAFLVCPAKLKDSAKVPELLPDTLRG